MVTRPYLEKGLLSHHFELVAGTTPPRRGVARLVSATGSPAIGVKERGSSGVIWAAPRFKRELKRFGQYRSLASAAALCTVSDASVASVAFLPRGVPFDNLPT